MSFRQRRVHLVAFRVTDDEHARLQQACDHHGRNLSDFARSEILKALAPDTNAQRAEIQMADLKARVRELEILVMRHRSRLEFAPESKTEDTDGK